MKQNFIRTSDETTKETLVSCGYTLLNQEGSFYIFLNDGKMNFSDDVKKEVFYTNMLNM